MTRMLALVALVVAASAAKMPSCEEDTVANCLGDDADMSPEGIEKVFHTKRLCEFPKQFGICPSVLLIRAVKRAWWDVDRC